MITPPPPPPTGAALAAPVILHIGDYAFNAATILQVKRKKDKVTVYLVGGGWHTFRGDEAAAMWAWVTQTGTELKAPRRL